MEALPDFVPFAETGRDYGPDGIVPDVAATKKPRTRTPKPTARSVSKLSRAGAEASRLARRTLLLTTCDVLGWELARVAEALELATGADVIRALKELAPEEYEAARERGDVRRGRRAEDT